MVGGWGGLVLLALLAGPAAAQEEQYRERDVLDPERDEWVAEPRAPEAGPEDPLDRARALLAAGQAKRARKLLEAWVEAHRDDQRYHEGALLLGDAWFELRDFWRAVERYQGVADEASGEVFERANERCVEVARAFLSGEKRIVWRIFRLPAYDEGVELLDRVWERMPGTRLGELALKLKADFFYERGEFDLAQDEYANLVQQYPSGRYVQIAMLRSAAAAEAAFPGIRFSDGPLLEATERYRRLLGTFPAYAEQQGVRLRLDGIREQRAEKDLAIGRWYERTRQSGAAAFYYQAVLADWPDTLAAAEARTRLRALGVAREGPGAEDEPTEDVPPADEAGRPAGQAAGREGAP